MATKFRQSASIVILRSLPIARFGYDYDILMMKRGPKGRQANFWSYPGGVIDEDDSLRHPNWKQVFSKHPAKQLTSYLEKQDSFPIRDHRRRLGAIRQVFEEVRLPIVVPSSIDPEAQRVKSQNFKQFISQTESYPDLSGIQRFFRIITPKIESKRYDAQFYFYFLEDRALSERLIGSQGQVKQLAWMTPAELLDNYYKKKMRYLPPQFIINSFLSHHTSFTELRDTVMPKIDKMAQSGMPNIPMPMAGRVSPHKHNFEFESGVLYLWRGVKPMMLKHQYLYRTLFPGDEFYESQDYEQVMRQETGNPNYKYQGVKGVRNRQYWLTDGTFLVSHHKVSRGISSFGQEIGGRRVAPKL